MYKINVFSQLINKIPTRLILIWNKIIFVHISSKLRNGYKGLAMYASTKGSN